MNLVWRGEGEILIFGKRLGFKFGPEGDGTFPIINIAGEILGFGVKLKFTVGMQ